MRKIGIYLSMLLLAVIGLASCSEEYAQPPVITPEGGLGDGSSANPYSAKQILDGTKGTDVWVTGYIVGWIDTSSGNLTFNEETATFTAPATLNSNMLIAASPDEKNFENCIPVQLSGDVRNALNLKDNPGNLGKQVTVKGNVEKYFGKNESLKNLTGYAWGNKGTGDDPEPPVTGGGNGSADKPYNVAQMLAGQSGTGVWVTGYIVGYIKSNPDGASTLNEQWATFSADGAQASNIMIADSPTETDYKKCTSVQLPTGAVRSAVNLKDNPGNLGKQVSLKGSLAKYFGVNGLKETSAYAWGPKGEEGGTVTPPDGDAIYSALDSKSTSLSEGWTFENIALPEGIESVWAWKNYNGNNYLNGSAFINNTPNASEAYAVSPVIDLSGYKSASAAFDHAAKFQTTLTQLCGFVVREEGATAWTSVNVPTWPTAGSWTFANSGAIDLGKFVGKKIQVGFKYASSASGADTWEIQNLKITGTK